MRDNPTAAAPWLSSALGEFLYQKLFAEKALSQIDEEALHQPLDPHTNSLAVIVQHISGNLISRWTDPLTTDGEKAHRDRDSEFVDQRLPREALMERWDASFRLVIDTLTALSTADLERPVVIRGERHTLEEAVIRSLAHTSYHVGQIVFLARVLAKEQWKVLTVPRGLGASAAHNQRHWGDAKPGG